MLSVCVEYKIDGMDLWHSNRILYKKNIVSKKISECSIAYSDRCAISRIFNKLPLIPIIFDNLKDIRSFLIENNNTYNNQEILQSIQEWVRLELLLKFSKKPSNIQMIHSMLEAKSANYQWIKHTLGYAFITIIPNHLRYFVALLCGLLTYTECTQSNLMPKK